MLRRVWRKRNQPTSWVKGQCYFTGPAFVSTEVSINCGLSISCPCSNTTTFTPEALALLSLIPAPVSSWNYIIYQLIFLFAVHVPHSKANSLRTGTLSSILCLELYLSCKKYSVNTYHSMNQLISCFCLLSEMTSGLKQAAKNWWRRNSRAKQCKFLSRSLK